MYETLDRLIDVISPMAQSELNFSAKNMHPEAMRVYGGQVLAQCVSAAASTVAAGRLVHSSTPIFCALAIPRCRSPLKLRRSVMA